MHYRLRTLLIVLALGPPLIAVDANRQPLRAGRYSVSISGQNLPTKYQVGVGLMCEVAAGKNEISLDLQ